MSMPPDISLLLYGTAEQLSTPLRFEAGSLGVEITGGAVSLLSWNGIEVLCGIDYPVRDRDWGTAPRRERVEAQEVTPQGWHYRCSFAAGDFRGEFVCEGDKVGEVRLCVRLVAQQSTSVCRAGFVVLHPLEAAGLPLRVSHPDGTLLESAFPRRISPSQPAQNIAGLAWSVQGVAVDMRFEGDVFEMEDQRNWMDASYKTFCRPLSLPYPFDVAAGEVIEQTIILRLTGHRADEAVVGAASRTEVRVDEHDGTSMPEFGLALDPAWSVSGSLGPAEALLENPTRWLLRVDAARAVDLDWLAANAELLRAAPVDLEMLVDGAPAMLERQLRTVERALSDLGLRPDHLFVLPRAYMRCIQTWEPPPPGIQPADAVAAARHCVQPAHIGAGMLTNFTELNRCPPSGTFDYVTHSLTPLVHTADDRSVMRALDTLQPIFDTLAGCAGGLPWRLGLASIGMRTNPYGEDVAVNPEGVRVAMAQHDPRQAGLFGAAWMVGVAAGTLGWPVEFVALGAPYGPFGLAEEGEAIVRPAYHAFAALAQLSRRPRLRLSLPAGLRGVATADGDKRRAVIANCTAAPVDVDAGPGARVRILDAASAPAAARDRGWLGCAPRLGGQLSLDAFAVAFVDWQAGAAA